ncbi:MAG: DUF4252 domain-containing protein [Verrucomicrobia subdivision 3 bacterium]|nr:DUF4252 domain-containing protein [Limisphaerales bacterium]
MKRIVGASAGGLLFVMLLVLAARAEPSGPGYVDFSKLADIAEDSTVEINVHGVVLSIASRIAGKSEPEAAELLRSLKHIRVNVYKLNDKNREAIAERIKSMRTELAAQNWERIVTVKEKNDDVGVYLKTRGEEAIEGIVVTVIEGKGEAVFVNIVGDIKPDQLGAIADKLEIEPLKKIARKAKK